MDAAFQKYCSITVGLAVAAFTTFMFMPWPAYAVGSLLAVVWTSFLIYGLVIFGRPAWIMLAGAPFVIWPLLVLVLFVVCRMAGCDYD